MTMCRDKYIECSLGCLSAVFVELDIKHAACPLLALLLDLNKSATSKMADRLTMQMLTETLKLLIASLDAVTRHSPELQAKAMKLLVQLMVVCAQPEARQRHLALSPLISQTMTLLATGKYGAALRATLLSLSPTSRNVLQASLFTRSIKYT